MGLAALLVLLLIVFPPVKNQGANVRTGATQAGGAPVANAPTPGAGGATATTPGGAPVAAGAPAAGAVSPGAATSGGASTGGGGTAGATGGGSGTGAAAGGGGAVSSGGAAGTAGGGEGAASGTNEAGQPLPTTATDSGGGIRPKVDPPPGPQGCRADGRQQGISYRQPSCQPLFTGDNGGSTYRGVTDNTIKIVFYYATPNAATEAALAAAGVSDKQPDVQRIQHVLLRYFNTHTETYGREVIADDLVGRGTSEEAQRSDAIRIAEEMGAFACFGCPRFAAEELAARGVVTIITFQSTRDFFSRVRQTGPWVFGGLGPVDEHYQMTAEYWAKPQT